jgi:hypothetical protein
LAPDRNESVKEDEKDDPKSNKKYKVNLKPKMDEKMAKTYKEMLKYIKEKNSQSEDADDDMKAAREKKDRERKRAAASRQTDAYRGIEKSRPTKDNAPLHPESTVKEAVTDGGVEYGEQDWDTSYRIDHAYPNLGVNYAEFHEQGLEGPYNIDGEAYFFDRKVGSWYSVESEDYVDDRKSEELSFRYVKDGMYKPQFSN